MLLSSACEYALRSALYLATLKEDGYVPIRKISNALDISGPFLTKIFQQLTQAGLMESFRGPTGGVAFARPPSEVSVKDIIVAIDGEKVFRGCVLGLPGCGEQKPCPLHDEWAAERVRLEAIFSSMTLEEMADNVVQSDLRLKAMTAA